MNIVKSNGNLYTLTGTGWVQQGNAPIPHGSEAVAGVVYANQIQLYYVDGSSSLKYTNCTQQTTSTCTWSSIESLAYSNVLAGSPIAAAWNHEEPRNQA